MNTRINTQTRSAGYSFQLLIVCLGALLAGCKGPDVATGFSKGNIRTVTVDSRVPAFGMRLGVQTGGGTAGLADAIVNKMYAGKLRAIETSMANASINVPEMVRKEFINRLQSRDLVRIVDDNSDAVFQIEIRQFGFTEYPPFTGNDLPFLEVICRLLDKNENTLWKSTWLQGKRGYPGMGGSLADYTNSEKLQKDWDVQVKTVIEEILAPQPAAKK